MSTIGAGIFGNSSSDEYVAARTVNRNAESVDITFDDGSVFIFPAKAADSKVSLKETPAIFDRNVMERRAGGGGVNSRRALARIADEIGAYEEIRYLDANQRSSFVESELPSPVRWLELRPVPRNYVFGTRTDKCIFRSPIDGTAVLGPQQLTDIDWCCEAGTVLLNGPKDKEPIEAIFDRRSRDGFEVIFVLTPSLQAGFLKRTAVAADVLIGAWDELQFLTGPAPVSLDGAAMTAARLRELAPQAEIHVTMGKHGVLSMAAGSNDLVHVELDPASRVFEQVQTIVQTRPANLCGAGDAFAGGLMGLRAFDWSLLSMKQVVDSHVRAALAGCASALRWVGFRSDLPVEAFLVTPILAQPGQGRAWIHAA
jgi:sugar/nucleoside kinase (ribokinase family)